MSGEQRDNNLGIDPDLRNRDPAAYEQALRRRLEELTRDLVKKDPRVLTEVEWRSCENPVPMLRDLGNAASHRKLRLFAVACTREVCRNVPPSPPYPDYVARHLAELSNALSVAERYADGEIGAWELLAARKVAEGLYDVYCDSGGVMPNAVGTALGATEESIEDNFCRKTDMFDSFLCQHAEWGMVKRARQAELLRDIFGNPFRPITLDPSWLTSTVTILARTMYESRDFTAMPILADALQDAGCEDDQVLSHCRGEGVHVRGCFLIDLLTGRE
jgi:hypothetical protein